MATYATLTISADDIIGADFDKSRANATIEFGSDAGVLDAIKVDGTTVRLGNRREYPDDSGTITFPNLVTTSSASNPVTFYYRVTITYTPKGSRKQGSDTWTSAWFPLTANANLAAIDEAWDNMTLPVSWRSEFMDAAEALLDQQEAIAGLTGEDTAIANRVNTPGSATDVALKANYASQIDATGKSVTTLNAWLATPSPLGVKRITGTVNLDAPLVINVTRTTFDASGTTLNTSGDYPAITMATGQAQTLSHVKIVNSFAGVRTTFDIDIVNPTKPLLHDVEVNLPNGSTGKGGIRIRYDSGLAGNKFMPELDKVWIRNGHLIVDNVTDGHMHDCWVWAPNTGARAAVEFVNAANGWAITSCDIVPPINSGIGVYFEGINHTRLVGGYQDGNDGGLQTGYGIWAKDSGRLTFMAHGFWNLGRSGLTLENCELVKVIGCDFSKNNKQDNGYPDIDLINSKYNTFLSNAHWAPDARTNKGVIYREDTASVGNRMDYAMMPSSTDYYARPLVIANAGTMGRNNRPESLYPRVSGAPDIIVPPASLIGVGAAAAWPAANTAILHRFSVTVGATYRFANFRIDTGSGNFQVAVLKLSGSTYTDYTRVMNSGVIAATAGDKTHDLGSTYLEPGEYALSLWFDNTTATARYATNSGVTAMRITGEVASLATGIPASGTGLSWSSGKYVGGMSLGMSV